MRLSARRLPALAATFALSGFVAIAFAAPVPPEPKVTLTPKPAGEAQPLPPPSGDAAFDATYAEAKVNEKAGAYDEALARYIYSAPGLYEKLDRCLALADRQRVHGYFEFAAGAGYRVVLKPEGPFASCIAEAHLGLALPAPPRRPYVHAFSFTPAPATP